MYTQSSVPTTEHVLWHCRLPPLGYWPFFPRRARHPASFALSVGGPHPPLGTGFPRLGSTHPSSPRLSPINTTPPTDTSEQSISHTPLPLPSLIITLFSEQPSNYQHRVQQQRTPLAGRTAHTRKPPLTTYGLAHSFPFITHSFFLQRCGCFGAQYLLAHQARSESTLDFGHPVSLVNYPSSASASFFFFPPPYHFAIPAWYLAKNLAVVPTQTLVPVIIFPIVISL
jgi:hypothetical protein